MNKYSAVRTTYNNVSYHSKREAQYAKDLDLLLKAKDIKSWVGQVPIPIILNGKKICTYILDFVITNTNGTMTYVDVKGMETPVFKLKKKLFEAYTGHILTVVK